jgi:hypothetical protein
MIKTKRNKFYIGKQEVTLFAVYLPDLLTDKPQEYYFHFNPKSKKFEMQKDKTFAYTASQVYFDSTFIIIAQHKKSERMDLVNDKTFLFEFFDEPMYEDEKELFLEHGKEEMDKITSNYKNLKKLLEEVGDGFFKQDKFISQYLKKEYGEDLIFTIAQNNYGYLLEIHKYGKTQQPLFKFEFNKDWGKQRFLNEFNSNLRWTQKFHSAIKASLESVEQHKLEIKKERAKEILSNCNIGEVIASVTNEENKKTIILIKVNLNNGGVVTFKLTQDLDLQKITKAFRNKGEEKEIDGVFFVKPTEYKETFANISTKINLSETDKWLPILDKL